MPFTLIRLNGRLALGPLDGGFLDPKVNELNNELSKVRQTIEQKKNNTDRAELEVSSIFDKVKEDALSVDEALKQALSLEQRLEKEGLEKKKTPFTIFAIDERGEKHSYPISPSVSISKILIHAEDQPVSDGQAEFMVDIDRAIMVIDRVFKPEDQRSKWMPDWHRDKRAGYLRELIGICHIGLEHADPSQLKTANKLLDSFRAAFFAKEVGTVKNNYLWLLGWQCLALSALASLVYICVRSWLDDTYVLHRFQSFFILVAGAGVGTWLSFSLRSPVRTFLDLAVLEEDRLDPTMRVLFITALTSIVGLFIWTKAVSLVLGGFSSEAFHASGAAALLIGLLLGISERTMATAVQKRATEFGAPLQGSAKE